MGGAVMKQKNGMPLAQAAAEDIIEMIRTNHMKPGDRLENEYELAKKLNVGRSTVREAVKSLETRNIHFSDLGSSFPLFTRAYAGHPKTFNSE